jgi:DNA excision repair protein ERCC-2
VRRGQLEFVQEASRALGDGEIFLVSAPCGVGKSLGSLLSILPEIGIGKLMICFRTRTQLHIYLKELRALGRKLSAVSLVSKKDMCPRKVRALSYYDFLDECRRLRENCSKKTPPYCRFYLNNARRREEASKLALRCSRELLPPLRVVKRMAREGFCAYEAIKGVLGKVDIFLGTYHYAFDPHINSSILKGFDVDLSRLYLIVDEAHNLPGFARELLSDRLTRRTVDSAIRETENFEHELVPTVRDALYSMEEAFDLIDKTHGSMEIRNFQPWRLDELIIENLGVSGPEAAGMIQDYGEDVREERRELGYENVYSYNYRVGEFLTNFFNKTEESYLHFSQKDKGGRALLEVRCLDGREITQPVLGEVKGGILMSGFLSPPKVYRDLILRDLSHVHLKEFESPFPPENRLLLVADDVSSKYQKRNHEMLQRWRDYIGAVLEANRGNVAVFHTSYKLMHRILNLIDSKRDLIVEKHDTDRETVLRKLKASDDNALFGVMGGKLSEGVDYPGDLLTGVVAVGLPYASWDIYQRGLIDYYNQQYPDRGWLYAYVTPAILRLVQTCGRVHRSAHDRGSIMILDQRVTQPQIKKLFPKYFQKEMKTVSNPDEAKNHIQNFWKKLDNLKTSKTKCQKSELLE